MVTVFLTIGSGVDAYITTLIFARSLLVYQEYADFKFNLSIMKYTLISLSSSPLTMSYNFHLRPFMIVRFYRPGLTYQSIYLSYN